MGRCPWILQLFRIEFESRTRHRICVRKHCNADHNSNPCREVRVSRTWGSKPNVKGGTHQESPGRLLPPVQTNSGLNTGTRVVGVPVPASRSKVFRACVRSTCRRSHCQRNLLFVTACTRRYKVRDSGAGCPWHSKARCTQCATRGLTMVHLGVGQYHRSAIA